MRGLRRRTRVRSVAERAAQRIAVHLEAEQRLFGRIDQRRAQHHRQRNLVARIGDHAQQMRQVVDLAAVVEAAAAIDHVRNSGGVERVGERRDDLGVPHQHGESWNAKRG